MTDITLNPAKGDTLEKWAKSSPADASIVRLGVGDHGSPVFSRSYARPVLVLGRAGAVVRGAIFTRTARNYRLQRTKFEASAVPSGPFAALVDTDAAASDLVFGGGAGYGCEFSAGPDIGAMSVAEKLALHSVLLRLRGSRMSVTHSHFHDGKTALHLMGVGARAEGNTIERFTVDGVDVANSGQRVLRNLIRDGRHFPEEPLHADAIQLQDTTASDILIEGNTIGPSPLADYLQGISGFDGAWSNVTIRNNDVTVKEAYHGATLFGGDCHVIEGNTIRQDGKIVPWVQIAKRKDGTPPKGCSVKGNTSPKLVMESAGVTYSGNCRPDGVPLPA